MEHRFSADLAPLSAGGAQKAAGTPASGLGCLLRPPLDWSRPRPGEGRGPAVAKRGESPEQRAAPRPEAPVNAAGASGTASFSSENGSNLQSLRGSGIPYRFSAQNF